jgi:hypothetical protein
VTSQASIVFDTNPALATNTLDNTIDAGAPAGTVSPLPLVTTPSFPVSWKGADGANESGLDSFDVYVSVNGGQWKPWLTHTPDTSAVYAGQLGTTYAFAAVSVDAAGNRTALPAPISPQAQTRTPIFSHVAGTVAEDAKKVPGIAVSTLLGSSMSDADAGAVQGIAVTGLVGNGKWEFSKDGKTWKSLAGASESAAFLLPDTYQVHFLPAKDWNGTAGLLFRGWDRTFGTAGGRAAVAAPDAGNPFTADGGYATVTVTPVNDAPVLPAKPAVTLMLPSPKSPNAPFAQAVSALVQYGSDVDGDALGIAITTVTGTGTWEYSTDGNSWTPFPAVSAKQALLLQPTDFVHFLPDNRVTGQATLTFKAWDQSSGARGIPADTTAKGATAFSSRTAQATTLINSEPVLAGNSVALTMSQDPATNKGFLVSTLVAKRIADDPKSKQGVAIVGLSGGDNGAWQFSVDAGKTWKPLGSATDEAGLLLRSADKLRFLPNAGFRGADAATLTYKAWDQTYGTAGTRADVSVDAPGTFFSSGALTASLTVTPVAERPVLGAGLPAALASFLPAGTPTTGLVSDFLAGSRGATGLAVVGSTGKGVWEFSPDGSQWNPIGTVPKSRGLLIAGTYLVRFSPTAQAAGPASLTVKAWDGSGGTAGNTVAIAASSIHFSKETGQVTVGVNIAPALATSSPTFADILEDATKPAGATVAELLGTTMTDSDTGFLQGLAVTGVTGSAYGTWQYNFGGKPWLSVGNVLDDSALLLRPTDKLRFLPNANFNGQVGLTFRAWDQTSGTVGTHIDASINGGSSAFSTNAVTATENVKPVNDAPVTAPGYGTGKVHLPPVTPGDTSPASVTVANLVAGWVIDLDGDSLGIAVTGLTTQGGHWEVDTGSGFTKLEGVSNSSAMLLKATDLIRFVPDVGFTGSAQLSFRAWDQTKGTAGSKPSIASLGNSVGGSDLLAPVWVNTSPVLS